MNTIRVAIDVVALEGFSPRQAGLFQSALERELESLIREGGLPPSRSFAGEIPSVVVPAPGVQPGQPERAGLEVARALYRRLSE